MINLTVLHLNENVIGVYSSEEKANAAMTEHQTSNPPASPNSDRYYHIREFTLDEPAS